VHQCSPRKNAPFVVATVAAPSNGRSDELLFGRESGGETRRGVLLRVLNG
jgi:DNA-binding NtrC family response regulator